MVLALLVALVCALLAIVALVVALVRRPCFLVESPMSVTFEPAVAPAEGRSRSCDVTKIVLSVAGSTFEVQGQFSGDLSVLDLLTRWLASLPAAEDQARIAALTAQLRQQSDSLAASVSAQQGITQKKE